MTKRSKIPARILALLLAVCLLASTVTPALAANVDKSTRYTNGLVVDGSTGWNSAGGDQYLLENEFDVTILFENTPFLRNSDNWSNFVFEIYGGENTKGFTFRADNWGWSYGEGSQEPTFEGTNTWNNNWEVFQDICRRNTTVTLNLKKTSDTVVTAVMRFGSAASQTYTITYPDGVPSSMRVQVGADGGRINILGFRDNKAGTTVGDGTYTIGTFLSKDVPAYGPTGDFSITYTFKNQSQGSNVWENFVFHITGDNNTDFYARADAWGTGSPSPGLLWEYNSWNFDLFQPSMKDADVAATITRIGNDITFIYEIEAKNGQYYLLRGKTTALPLPEKLSVQLTGENVKLSDIKLIENEKVTKNKDHTDVNTQPVNGTTSSRVSVHDPSIVKSGNTYYIFGSHLAWAKSTDLINWTPFTNNINTGYNALFEKEASWSAHGSWNYDLGGNLWAPDLYYNNGKWYMYMSVNGTNWYSSIVLLTATNIEGPYTYVGPVVYSGFMNTAGNDFKQATGLDVVDPKYYTNETDKNIHTYGTNAIDPCVVDDGTNLWMTYGSWFGGIYMIKLNKSTGLRDYTYKYDESNDELKGKGLELDVYQGIKIAGGYGNSGEASYLEKIGDYWYLFLSYGWLESNGGYNMRVFRSKDITGPYVDLSGDTAIYNGLPAGNEVGANINGTVGNRLMSYYKWNYMDFGFTAQGHNSAIVDGDKAFVVYHTRFDNRGEIHEVRVHQLFVNEDGWLVAAPFEYAGETLGTIADADVAGAYEVLFHESTDYAGRKCVTGKSVLFGADGTLSGDVTGTWAWSSKGSPYVTLTANNKTYKGVFLKQKMEERDTEVLCFTVLGNDEISVWGYQEQNIFDMIVEDIGLPVGTFGQALTLPSKGLFGAEITWTSGNTKVIATDGTVLVPNMDTTVILTATITCGGETQTHDFPVRVFADKSLEEKEYVLWEYFTSGPQDLSGAGKGTLQYPNPFNKNNVLGVSTAEGVFIEFEVKRNGSLMRWSNVLAFNAGEPGGLYFTGGSYLGYNADGGWFDANNGDEGTDYIGNGAIIKIHILSNGFEVYVNGELAYTQDDIGGKVPGGKRPDNEGGFDFSKFPVLSYLNNAATYLNFGWGNWWIDKFDGTISNVKLSVAPTGEVDRTALVDIIAKAGALNGADYTRSSYEGVTGAVEEGKTVRDNVGATQAEINAAVKAIHDAIAALEKLGDIDALKAAIEQANAKNESSYTPASWANLKAAVDAAQALVDEAEAGTVITQTQVNAAVKAIEDAIAALRTPTPSSPSGGNTGTPNVTTGSSDDDSETTETTAKPSATVKGETATSNVSSSMGNEIVKQAEKNNSDTVVIEPNMPDTVTSANVTIPSSTLTQIGEKTDADVTVKTPAGTVTIPNEALEKLGSAGRSVTISVTATDDNTISVDIKAGGQSVENIDGGIKAALPLGDGQVAVLVDAEGNETVIQKSLVEDGVTYVLLDGTATVKIVDKSKDFDDVNNDVWYSDAVTFASSHELFKGTGDGSTFSPGAEMTRAMLVTVLWRLESEANAGEGVINFSDSVNGTWYADAVAWASAAGIANGTGGNVFSPDDNTSREQLATMLYRYAGHVGLDTGKRADLSVFTDGTDVSSWAGDAMEWAVAVGLIGGKGNSILDARGTATRVEAAIVLQRMVGLLVK